MRPLILLLILPFFSYAHSMETTLDVFETDYCTNYPEGTKREPELWKHCCLKHDLDFWAGGTEEDRFTADLELKSCIEKTGNKKQAQIMYWGVRLGSYSPVKYPKRKWNNGWPDRSDFQALTGKDIDLIERELFRGYDFIDGQLKLLFIEQLRRRLE